MEGSGVFLRTRSFKPGLWSTVFELIHRKWYLIGLALLAAGGYGFRLSHPVSGVDDICAGLYFVDGLVAIIGRWPLFLLGQLFPIGHYAPFLMDLWVFFLMVAAAILWCALLQHILDRPLSTWACLVFSGAFVNFALNSEVFIYYLHNGAGLGNCLIPLSLYLVYSDRRLDLKSGKKRHVLLTMGATALLTVAIGLYESFASVFLTGLCLIVLADGLSLDRMQTTKWRRTALLLCYSARVMVYAMAFRGVITRILRGWISLDYSYYRSPTVCFVAVPARCRSTAASAVGVVSPAVSVSWLGQSVSVLGACSAGRFSAGWDCSNSSEKTGHLPALGCGCLPFAFCTFSHFRGTADAAFLSGASPLCRRRIAGRVATRGALEKSVDKVCRSCLDCGRAPQCYHRDSWLLFRELQLAHV